LHTIGPQDPNLNQLNPKFTDIPPQNMNPVLIENSKALDDICDKLCREPILAIDTEFFRETTYFPHLGLIQIASPDCIICIDPLAFDARLGVARLLLNNSITKIFHACSQDMEVLYQYLGELPYPIVDTQVAAAMLGLNEQIGYATLVEELMGVQLEKSQTRTNWLKRPLTKKQIEYAGDDVLYLIPLYSKLISQLKSKNRESWFLEDCARFYSDKTRFHPDMKNCWHRIKGIYKLKDIQLCIAYDVAQWREQHAIKKDVTRKRAIPDDIVIQIAIAQPDSVNALKKTGSIMRWLDTEELNSLATVINTSINKPKKEWPSLNKERPTPEEKTLLRKILDLLDKKSGELGLAQSILCSRKDAEKLIHHNHDIQLLKGWRFDCIGRELLDVISTDV
jgi:ribonuclease D